MMTQLKCFFAGTAATVFAAGVLGLTFARSGEAAGASGYHLSKTIPIGGEGFWDYATVDAEARRIYVSHGTHVVVLDADTQAVVGDIPDTQGVHGIAIAEDAGPGFGGNGIATNINI